ncbi:serine/threonine-protein kinase [[Synechococcus] sp. NIES-970]|nr:serine/threonine-protein kinase [[Synechococcus] sp. NIES-970]
MSYYFPEAMTQQTIGSGRYQILRELGSGGFGVTYLVKDGYMPSQPVRVAKQLRPLEDQPAIYRLVQERFQREAVLLEELGSYPQIPSLYAYFEEDGKFYLVQEYVEGQTLEALLQSQGPQSAEVVRQILLDTLDILDFIETKQIIHRDIKPENIILRAADQKPVLIDFGAVREIMGTQMMSSGATPKSSIVIGTPGFMPPEQASGRPVFSSDLYALALTMIYLLTGLPPQDLQHDPITGDLTWPSGAIADQHLVAVLNFAIKPNPKERFMTAKAMKAALGAIAANHQATEVAPEMLPTIVASTIASAPVSTPQASPNHLGSASIVPPTEMPSGARSPQHYQEELQYTSSLDPTTEKRSRGNPWGLVVGLVVLGLGGYQVYRVAQRQPTTGTVQPGTTPTNPTPGTTPSVNPPSTPPSNPGESPQTPPPPTPTPPSTPPVSGVLFGAIAFSEATGEYGYVIDVASQAEAEQAAVDDCEFFAESGDCRALVWFQNACGAIAMGPEAYGSGWGADVATAEAAAVDVCSDFGSGCAVVDSICTTPPE